MPEPESELTTSGLPGTNQYKTGTFTPGVTKLRVEGLRGKFGGAVFGDDCITESGVSEEDAASVRATYGGAVEEINPEPVAAGADAGAAALPPGGKKGK